jgi:hypothetical protein
MMYLLQSLIIFAVMASNIVIRPAILTPGVKFERRLTVGGSVRTWLISGCSSLQDSGTADTPTSNKILFNGINSGELRFGNSPRFQGGTTGEAIRRA